MYFSPFPSRALIQSAVFLALLLVLMPNASHASSACTHHASPNGTGNGLSVSQPFKIANFWAVAGPGKTLCLADGTYTGATSMITPPSGLNGNSLAPITIKAINDGGAWINGQSARIPVLLKDNDWFVLEGFNASDSNGGVVIINSGADSNVIRRVCAWNAPPTLNQRVWGIVGDNALVEDSCGFGTGRRIFAISQGGDNTILRRTWAMFEKDTSLTGPESAYQFAYHSTNNTLENVIGTWKQASSGDAVNPFGVMHFANEGANHKVLGSIAYIRSGDIVNSSRLIGTDWSAIAHGPITIKDVVSYSEQPKTRFWLHNHPCTTCKFTNNTGIGGTISNIGSVWNVMNGIDAATPSSAPSIWNGAGTQGARVCYRYEDGSLTSTKLWPWPMDQRIRAALVLAGKNPDVIFGGTGKTLTDLMESMFGTIPSSCKTSTSVVNVPSIPTAASNLRVTH